MKLTTKEYFIIKQEGDNLLKKAGELEVMAKDTRRRALALVKICMRWEDETYSRIDKDLET